MKLRHLWQNPCNVQKRTMCLIGLQALNTEHKFMGWAVYKTKTLPAQIQIKGAIVDCLLLKCNSKDDEQIVKEYFAKQWLPYGEPFARVKRIRDTSHIKLKRASSSNDCI